MKFEPEKWEVLKKTSEINLDLREQRQALIFGICISIIAFFLYSNGVLQSSAIRGGEYFFAFLFALPCLFIGFIGGLIFFVDKSILGLFFPFVVFAVHIFLFGNISGDDLDEAFLQIFYLILSVLITFFLSFLIGFAIDYVNEGK